MTKANLDVAIAGFEAPECRMRAEFGTVRWTIDSLAALVFAIGLRVFGLLMTPAKAPCLARTSLHRALQVGAPPGVTRLD